MKHKRILSMLVLPLAFAVGCDDEKAAEFVAPAFTGEFQTFVDVAGTFETSTHTRNYVWYDGEVFEADALSPTANTATNTHCVVKDTDIEWDSTRSEDVEKGQRVQRYVGSQHVWVVRESADGSNIWDSTEMGTANSMDDADIYFIEPILTPYDYNLIESDDDNGTYGEYFASVNTSVHDMSWYIEFWENLVVDETDLFFFETSEHYRNWVTSTTVKTFNSIVTTTISTSSNGFGQSTNMAWHTPLDGWIWEIDDSDFGSAEDVYVSSVNAELLVPENVQVGDTWMSDEQGDTFAAAITTQDLTLADGTTITTLVIVERGLEDNGLDSGDILSQCLDFYNSTTTTNDGVTQPVDSLALQVSEFGLCQSGNKSLDFVNVATYWYYQGHVVKSDTSESRIDLVEWGYARLDPANGNCTEYSNLDGGLPISIDVTEVTEYKPFVRFQMVDTVDSFMATEIRDTNVLVESWNQEFGSGAGSDASSESTSTTETTTTTE